MAHEILHSLMDKDENNSLRVSSLESVASLSQVETGRFTSNVTMCNWTGTLVTHGSALHFRQVVWCVLANHSTTVSQLCSSVLVTEPWL